IGEAAACYHFVVKDTCQMIGEPYGPFALRLWSGLIAVATVALVAGWAAHQLIPGPHLVRWLSVGTITTAVSIAVAWAIWFTPDAVSWTTAVVLALLAIHSFTVSRKLGENPWLFPLSLMMVFYFVRYGMGALIIYFYDDFPWETSAEQSDIFVFYGMKQNIPSGCQLLLLGALGLYLGCAGSMPAISKWLPALNWPIDAARFKLNLTLYAPVGVVIFLVG